MGDDVIRVRVRVHGRVQGVYFRQSTAREAAATGVTGWVRNASDGSVEAVFEGPRHAVGHMLGYVRSGPPNARVDEVEERPEPPEGDPGFLVR